MALRCIDIRTIEFMLWGKVNNVSTSCTNWLSWYFLLNLRIYFKAHGEKQIIPANENTRSSKMHFLIIVSRFRDISPRIRSFKWMQYPSQVRRYVNLWIAHDLSRIFSKEVKSKSSIMQIEVSQLNPIFNRLNEMAL